MRRRIAYGFILLTPVYRIISHVTTGRWPEEHYFPAQSDAIMAGSLLATIPLLIATVFYMLAYGSVLLDYVVYQLGAGDRTGPDPDTFVRP